MVYQTQGEFLAESFQDVPNPTTLWLKDEEKAAANEILGHPYRGLRIRYWTVGDRSAWVLNEIGKERPITMGILIDGDEIKNVEILEYRESRGGEVRHSFFTAQFLGLSLTDDKQLSGRVDGISGATLSVRAVKKMSRYALYLHQHLSIEQQVQ